MAKRTIRTDVTETVSPPQRSNEYQTNSSVFRPVSLDEYVGQTQAKRTIQIAVRSAKARSVPLGHILLYGPPGLGKTTLAYLCAKEMGAPIVYTVGSNLEKPCDIVSILNSLQENSILFIDEIHRTNRQAEECLYSAMEDGFVSVTIGQAEQAKTIKLSLPPFTLIGATTRAGMVSAPLRDRFTIQCKMEYYSDDELAKIALASCKKLDIKLSQEQLMRVASISRGTPRIANRYLTLIRDYAFSENKGIVDNAVFDSALTLAGVNKNGLTDMDMKLLSVLSGSDKPVGLSTLSHILGEDPQTVEEVYEPYLIMKQFIVKTARGRQITPLGEQICTQEGNT